MQLFGRDQKNLDVIAAEFLPDGKKLFIISADGDGTLHVLQYDPENPKSERGTKLLHRSTFHSGAFPTGMTLLPRTAVSSETSVSISAGEQDIAVKPASQQILVTTQEGGLALITPLPEQSYRRLSTLQNILIANLEHPCGLNPRAYRAVETDGIGGRAIIDGNVVQKWLDQSSQQKSSTADKSGGAVWDIRVDLEAIGGGGLGFL
jgi:cleavage and polyadenylation specificity factor subunit 1